MELTKKKSKELLETYIAVEDFIKFLDKEIKENEEIKDKTAK